MLCKLIYVCVLSKWSKQFSALCMLHMQYPVHSTSQPLYMTSANLSNHMWIVWLFLYSRSNVLTYIVAVWYFCKINSKIFQFCFKVFTTIPLPINYLNYCTWITVLNYCTKILFYLLLCDPKCAHFTGPSSAFPLLRKLLILILSG